MPRFSQEFINKVIEATDIVSEISKQTNLKRKGSRYMGVCPFHNEKTPSFSVEPDKQLYYCFGCGVGGNVISFVMDFYKFSFIEAVEYLANQANIPIVYENYSKEEDDKYKQRKRVHQINRDAANFYFIQGKRHKPTIEYLKGRALSDDTIRTFGIGYAPNKRDILYRYLKSKNYADEDILLSSLVRKNEYGYYDYFRNRVMFPILDIQNNIVAFGGRVFDNSQPKYLNSPETVVFTKHNMLFNMNNAKKFIVSDPLILVEGYMDVISLYDKGIKNVCASLGTAFTESHAALIRRYTQNVVLCYDGDTAGKNAAVRGIEILSRKGLEPKILALENSEDPDSFVKKYGREAFLEKVKQSTYATDFTIQQIADRYDLTDIVQKSRFIKETCRLVGKIDDEIKWDYYVKMIASRTDTDLSIIKKEIYKSKNAAETPDSGPKNPNPGPARHVNRAVDTAQRTVLLFLSEGYDNFLYFKNAGGDCALFIDGEYIQLYEQIEKKYIQNPDVDIIDSLISDTKLSTTLSKVTSAKHQTKSGIMDYIVLLKKAALQVEMHRVKKEIEAASRESCVQKAETLLKEYNYLKMKLLSLK